MHSHAMGRSLTVEGGSPTRGGTKRASTLLVLVMTAGLGVGTLTATPALATTSPGLMTSYSADGTPSSDSGLDNGTWAGPTPDSYGPGASGNQGDQAFQFNGDGSNITMDSQVVAFGTSDARIAFDINTTTPYDSTVLSGRDSCDGATQGWFNISVGGSLVGAEFATGGNYAGDANPTPINDGVWHHVDILRTGTRFAITVDGGTPTYVLTPAGDLTPNVPLSVNNGPCTFQNSSLPFAGLLDNISVGVAGPSVLTQPADQSTPAGQPVTFYSDSDSIPAPTVQWQRSTDGGGSFTDVTGETSSDYTFTPALADSGNLYQAVFTNANGQETGLSAMLTVTPVAPAVTTQPQDTTVASGTAATFYSDASGIPTPTVQWQRSTDGVIFSDVVGATDTTLTVDNPMYADSGNLYRAVFTNVADTATSDPAGLTVTPVPGVVPSAPLDVHASQTGPGRVTITWNPPTSQGNSAVTGYGAGYSTGQSGNGSTVPAAARSAVFTGLANRAYSFSVAAENDAGSGPRVSVDVTVAAPDKKTPTESVSARRLVAGKKLTVSGTGVPRARLTLDRALPGHKFKAIRTVMVGTNGRYSTTITVTHTGRYRTRGATGLVSVSHKVVVQNRMKVRSVRNGFRTYTLSGTVYPASKGQVVKIYYVQRDGTYLLFATRHTDRAGRWTYKYTFDFSKKYTLKVVSVRTALNASNTAKFKIAAK